MNTDKPDAVELLPCPFCGGSAAFDLNDDRTSSEFVMCKQCGISTDLSDDRAELVTLWNTRDTAERDALKAEVAAGRRLLGVTDYILFDNVTISKSGDKWHLYLDRDEDEYTVHNTALEAFAALEGESR